MKYQHGDQGEKNGRNNEKRKTEFEWSRIITNTVSVVIAVIVLGAANIVWEGATSIDTKIEKAKKELEKTIIKGDAAMELLSSEIVDLHEVTSKLENLIDGHHKVLMKVSNKNNFSEEHMAHFHESLRSRKEVYDKKMDLDRINEKYVANIKLKQGLGTK